MRACRIANLTEFDSLSISWNRLAGDGQGTGHGELRQWSSQPSRAADLYVLTVVDHAGDVIGIAPWIRERSATRGRVVRFPNMQVQPPGLVCKTRDEDLVAAALAEWLTAPPSSDRWDLLCLDGISTRDEAIAKLLARLHYLGNRVRRLATCAHRMDVEIVPRRASARLRHTVRLAGDVMKHWLVGSSDAVGVSPS